jgi:hypothetical protein
MIDVDTPLPCDAHDGGTALAEPPTAREAHDMELREPPGVLQELSALDDRLVKTLEEGDMALVRSAWVLNSPVDRMLRRQELKRLAEDGASPSPLLEPEEAAALVRRCDRSVGALTVRHSSNPGCRRALTLRSNLASQYGWLSPGDPDPAGKRLEVVRAALTANPHIEGFFWDYASLFQARLPSAVCSQLLGAHTFSRPHSTRRAESERPLRRPPSNARSR